MSEKSDQPIKRIEKKGGYGAGTKAVSELKPPPNTPGVGTNPTSEGGKKSER